jgi:hypothetical protein
LNLKSPTEPRRIIKSTRAIWLPSKTFSFIWFFLSIEFFSSENWIVERTYPLPVERIPTQFAKYTYTSNEEENRINLINSDVISSKSFEVFNHFLSSVMHCINSDEKQSMKQQQDIHFGDGNYSRFEHTVGFQIQFMHYVYDEMII